MGLLDDSWLVGTTGGLYAINGDGACRYLAPYRFRVVAICRHEQRTLLATGSGLWEIGAERWIQRHDETLTEVHDAIDDGKRVIVASAYGLAVGQTEPTQATHWDWRSASLPVNQRFTNAILRLDDGRILAATEGGILLHHDDGRWQPASLQDTAVRCLLPWGDGLLAGADNGVWWSDDGVTWRSVFSRGAVYALAHGGQGVLAGSEYGVWRAESVEQWHCAGLGDMRVSAIGYDTAADICYAGGSPGGLWRSADGGHTWQAVADIRVEVEAISPPGDVQ